MDDFKHFNVYLQSFLYVVAGLNHFRAPRFYEFMIPNWIPAPKTMVWLSGVAEIALGILYAIPQTRNPAAWGIALLLIAIFPANIQMALKAKQSSKFPPWLLYARLPLQFALIAWALSLRHLP